MASCCSGNPSAYRFFELEVLPSMETLLSLEGLQEHGCVKLKCMQGLVQTIKLRELDISRCYELPSMETLISLER